MFFASVRKCASKMVDNRGISGGYHELFQRFRSSCKWAIRKIFVFAFSKNSGICKGDITNFLILLVLQGMVKFVASKTKICPKNAKINSREIGSICCLAKKSNSNSRHLYFIETPTENLINLSSEEEMVPDPSLSKTLKASLISCCASWEFILTAIILRNSLNSKVPFPARHSSTGDDTLGIRLAFIG